MADPTDQRTLAERRLYERLTVYSEDLAQAEYFAKYLVHQGWHLNPLDPKEKKFRWTTYLRQAGFTTALVAAYCRPFTETRSAPSLSPKLCPYSATEWELHEKLKKLRNTIYAHSEIELHNIRPVRHGHMARFVVLGLSKQELKRVESMIKRTIKQIDKKRGALTKTLLRNDD